MLEDQTFSRIEGETASLLASVLPAKLVPFKTSLYMLTGKNQMLIILKTHL